MGWLPAEHLLQDFSFGWRMLRRSAGVTIPAVLTLALAVASTTSIFTIADAVLLAPLPYGKPDQVVVLSESYQPQGVSDMAVASGNFLEWHARSRTLPAMTAVDIRQQNLTRHGDPAGHRRRGL